MQRLGCMKELEDGFTGAGTEEFQVYPVETRLYLVLRSLGLSYKPWTLSEVLKAKVDFRKNTSVAVLVNFIVNLT